MIGEFLVNSVPPVVRSSFLFFIHRPVTRKNFYGELLERDERRVFSRIVSGVEAMHINPFARGDEWFRLIVSNRPAYDENVLDRNDIRNGMIALPHIT